MSSLNEISSASGKNPWLIVMGRRLGVLSDCECSLCVVGFSMFRERGKRNTGHKERIALKETDGYH